MIKQNNFVDSCLAAESGLAKTLESSYLIKVFDSLIEYHPSGIKVNIYMEYCDGSTLALYIPKLSALKAAERKDVCASLYLYSFVFLSYSLFII